MSFPCLRKTFGNSQGQISLYEYPDSPRYEISELRLDRDRPTTLLTTDSLIEAELAFRQAIAEL